MPSSSHRHGQQTATFSQSAILTGVIVVLVTIYFGASGVDDATVVAKPEAVSDAPTSDLTPTAANTPTHQRAGDEASDSVPDISGLSPKPTWIGPVVAGILITIALICFLHRISFISKHSGAMKLQPRSKGRSSPKQPAIPPYPDGWYAVCSSIELKKGKVIPVSALGVEMVVFRGGDGKAGALHAFCPHLGTHLGHGGKVVGSNLVCPYHQWAFDANGTCNNIPYSPGDTKNRKRLKAKTYECQEKGGMVYIWYDGGAPLCEAPRWPPPSWDLANTKVQQRLSDWHMHLAEACLVAGLVDERPWKASLRLPLLPAWLAAVQVERTAAVSTPQDGFLVQWNVSAQMQLSLFGGGWSVALPLSISSWLASRLQYTATASSPQCIHLQPQAGGCFAELHLMPQQPFRIEVRLLTWNTRAGLSALFVGALQARGLQDMLIAAQLQYEVSSPARNEDAGWIDAEATQQTDVMQWIKGFYNDRSQQHYFPTTLDW